MDLQNMKIKFLAKANNGIEFIYTQAKACGNSNGNSLNRNMALAPSTNNKAGGNSNGNSLNRNMTYTTHSINDESNGNSLNRNAALAHSHKIKYQNWL
jgi:hypothetical protein